MQVKHWYTVIIAVGVSAQFMPATGQAQTQLPSIVVEGAPAATPSQPSAAESQPTATATDNPSTAIDGYVAESSGTGTKTNTPLREIPQSVSIVTREQLDDRGVQKLSEAIGYSAGVTVNPYGLDARCDQFVIRGFEQNTTGMYRDGLRLPTFSFNCFRIETYGVDHIDILRGPTSTLYGLNNPGGLVNIVSKMPTDKAFGEVWAAYGTHNNKQTGFDIGDVSDNGKVAYRVTGLVRDADTQVDFVEDDRIFIAPAVTFKPSNDTTLTILGHYQKDKSGDTFQILPLEGTLVSSPYGHIPASRFLGEPDFSKRDSEEWSVGYQFEHKLDPAVTFRQNLRYDHAELEYNTLYGGGQLDGTPYLLRFAQQADQSLDVFQVDNQLQFDSRFDRIENTLLVGTDYSYFSGKSQIRFAVVGNSGGAAAPFFDPFNPTYGQYFFFIGDPSNQVAALPLLQDRDQTQEQFGLYIQDQIKFDKHWVLTLNGRQDWVTSEVKDHPTDFRPSASKISIDDKAFTGRVGLSYLFDNGLTPYASYSTSFFPVGVFGTTASGGVLSPEESVQYEAGIKFQPKGFKSYAIVSVFDLTKQNNTVLNADQIFYSQTGEINVKGIEFEGVLDFDNGLRVLAAYSHWNPKITEDEDSAIVGKQPERIPNDIATLWIDYTFHSGELKGLGLGAGVRYVGDRFGDNANTIKVPSYTLFDAGIRYQWDQWNLSLNVNNVFDTEYVGTCGTIADPTPVDDPNFPISGYNYCSYGEGRTALLKVSYRW